MNDTLRGNVTLENQFLTLASNNYTMHHALLHFAAKAIEHEIPDHDEFWKQGYKLYEESVNEAVHTMSDQLSNDWMRAFADIVNAPAFSLHDGFLAFCVQQLDFDYIARHYVDLALEALWNEYADGGVISEPILYPDKITAGVHSFMSHSAVYIWDWRSDGNALEVREALQNEKVYESYA